MITLSLRIRDLLFISTLGSTFLDLFYHSFYLLPFFDKELRAKCSHYVVYLKLDAMNTLSLRIRDLYLHSRLNPSLSFYLSFYLLPLFDKELRAKSSHYLVYLKLYVMIMLRLRIRNLYFFSTLDSTFFLSFIFPSASYLYSIKN
jgi:hypothetical protein